MIAGTKENLEPKMLENTSSRSKFYMRLAWGMRSRWREFAVLMGRYNECIWSAITSTSDDPLRIHGECAFAVEAAVWQCTGSCWTLQCHGLLLGMCLCFLLSYRNEPELDQDWHDHIGSETKARHTDYLTT